MNDPVIAEGWSDRVAEKRAAAVLDAIASPSIEDAAELAEVFA